MNAVAAALVAMAVAGAGCCTVPQASVPVAIEEFRSAQAARVERTAAVSATGTLELRWRDGDGAHFESADAQWWIERPGSMALLLKKLGERMALAGCDGERAWVIDLRTKPARLRTIERGDEPEGWAQALLPMHLAWLMGMEPLPASEPDRQWQEGDLSWAQWAGRAIAWDRSGRPSAARVLVGARIAAESALDDGQWRTIGGIDALPGHCSLRSPDHDASADLYLYEPSAFEPGSKDKLLRLGAIREAIRPEVVP
jgi:hypothetical protein